MALQALTARWAQQAHKVLKVPSVSLAQQALMARWAPQAHKVHKAQSV